MALCAVCCIAALECLGAVMALAASLAAINVSHGILATLLHRKDLCVAVITFKTFVSVYLAVKYNLAHGTVCKCRALHQPEKDREMVQA